MSRTLIIGILALLAIVLAAAAYWFVHPASTSSSPANAAARSPHSPAPSGPAESSPPPPAELKKSADPLDAARKESVASEPVSPVRTGEILDFTADVAKVSSVATLRLQTTEKRNLRGKNAWHLQAFAHTQNPLRMVFPLDDQFDSYSDAHSLVSLQYELHLNERGQKVDSIQHLTTTGRDPAPPDASLTVVLPGTRDPLGFLQFLRTVDWSKTPQIHGPVYDGHKLYDVRANLASRSQSVAVQAGSFTASKIDIHVFDDGAEMKDARFALYLANDAAQTPVLLEAILPWTTARVGLKSKP